VNEMKNIQETGSVVTTETMQTAMDRKAALRAVGVLGALALSGKLFEGRANLASAKEAMLTAESAAERFGGDDYSSNPENWDINEYGGAHLTPNESGDITRINMDGTAGEFYVDLQSPDPMGSAGAEWGVRALTFVVDGRNAPTMDVRGGTIWPFPANSFTKNLENLWNQVTTKEVKEQPGILVIPAGFTPGEAC
jgi:hypothetical protein